MMVGSCCEEHEQLGARLTRRSLRIGAAGSLLLAAAAIPTAWGQAVIPFGYRLQPVVTGGLNRPAAMARDAAGSLYVTEFGPGGGFGGVKIVIPGNTAARDYATIPQLESPAGIVLQGTRIIVSNRASGVDQGQIVEYIDRNGNLRIDDPGEFRFIFTDLPQGLNGTRALVSGPAGKLYVGQGSITSSSATEPAGYNSTVFRFDPLQSPGVPTREIFASGFYNPLGIAFGPDARAFVTDRSPAQETGPDEVNLATQGDYFGFAHPPVPGTPPKAPLVAFPHFSSPAGVAYFPPSDFTGGQEVVFVALEGHPAGLPDPAPRVVRLVLTRLGQEVTAQVEDFIVGLDRPFGLLKITLGTGADALLISDLGADIIYQVRLRLPTDPPDLDLDRSGRVDSGDLFTLIRERMTGVVKYADFYPDGEVDARDLFILSSGWQGDAEG